MPDHFEHNADLTGHTLGTLCDKKILAGIFKDFGATFKPKMPIHLPAQKNHRC